MPYRPGKVQLGPKRQPKPAEQAAGFQLYRRARWRRLRQRVLWAEPACPCGRPSTEVDHIRPVSEGGGMFDRENLQALCSQCHGQKTAADVERRKRLEHRPADELHAGAVLDEAEKPAGSEPQQPNRGRRA